MKQEVESACLRIPLKKSLQPYSIGGWRLTNSFTLFLTNTAFSHLK